MPGLAEGFASVAERCLSAASSSDQEGAMDIDEDEEDADLLRSTSGSGTGKQSSQLYADANIVGTDAYCESCL